MPAQGGKRELLVAQFIWANHNELINLEAVNVIRMVVDDTMAHAYFSGSDTPVVMKGAAAASFLETFDGARPSKPDEE
jgi:hypothetical protein